jgi:glycosyltransferase involved in cell wall biosynthesis
VVSVVVCTCNRPGSVSNTVRALRAGADGTIEIIVIDQSEGSETEEAIAAIAAIASVASVVYRRSKRRGKGAALNEGLEIARGDIVVCTDDDCIPPPGWANAMARKLRSTPGAVLEFCRVEAVSHDKAKGYVPTYDLARDRVLTTVGALRDGIGLGAAMALRRDFVSSIGGFDESFGPGARFPSCDDWDLAIRALLTGGHVLETAGLSVVHDGFRTFEQGMAHSRRDWLAIGALFAKPLRAGHFGAAPVAAVIFASRALWPPLAQLLQLERPRGLGRVLAFARGFAAGLRTPVDARTLRFAKE